MTRDKYYQSQQRERVEVSDPNECFPPFFEAVLTPHRSMSPLGLSRVTLVAAGFASIYAVFLAAVGLWFAPLLLAVPVLALWIAFASSTKSGKAYEHVKVSPVEIHVRRVCGRGRTAEFRLNPIHTRIVIRRLEDEGVTAISLIAGAQQLSIGAFLNPADKASFADAFVKAIQMAKRDGLSVYAG